MSYCTRKSSKTRINVPSGASSSLKSATSFSTASKKTRLAVAEDNSVRETFELPSNDLDDVDVELADTQVPTTSTIAVQQRNVSHRTQVQSYMVDDKIEIDMMPVSNNNDDE